MTMTRFLAGSVALLLSGQLAAAQSICDIVEGKSSGLYIVYPNATEAIGEDDLPWKYDAGARIYVRLSGESGRHDKYRILMTSTDTGPVPFLAPNDADYVDVARERMKTSCPNGDLDFNPLYAAVTERAYQAYNNGEQRHSDMSSFHVSVNTNGNCVRTDDKKRGPRFNFKNNVVQDAFVDSTASSDAFGLRANEGEPATLHTGLSSVIAAPPEAGARCFWFPAPRPTQVGILGALAPRLAIALRSLRWQPDTTEISIGLLNSDGKDDEYSIDWRTR